MCFVYISPFVHLFEKLESKIRAIAKPIQTNENKLICRYFARSNFDCMCVRLFIWNRLFRSWHYVQFSIGLAFVESIISSSLAIETKRLFCYLNFISTILSIYV